MRRISAKQAKLGIALSRPVYDGRGRALAEAGTRVSEDLLRVLNAHGVEEIIIEDPRVADVPVQPLISPEVEGGAAEALREIIIERHGSRFIESTDLEKAGNAVHRMTKELFPEVIGEVNSAGCSSPDDYPYVQPAKVASLSLLLGKRAGIGESELAGLGMAALFKDIGSIVMPQGILDKLQPSEQERLQIQQHPLYGAEIISQYEHFGPEVAEGVFYHHERWDGSGYPEGLKGHDIPTFARILGMADTYYELVSKRPDTQMLMPHEAVEYIMASGGDLFDPELVELFARQVPLYPTGVTVKLSTGQIGIISDSNLGHIGRPEVRIITDHKGQPVKPPYDVNLAETANQRLLVVQVMADE